MRDKRLKRFINRFDGTVRGNEPQSNIVSWLFKEQLNKRLEDICQED